MIFARVVRWLFVVFAAVSASMANAYTPAQWYHVNQYDASTPQAACEHEMDAANVTANPPWVANGSNGGIRTDVGGTYGACSWCPSTNPSCGSGDATTNIDYIGGQCGSNASGPTGGPCSCASGYNDNGTACVLTCTVGLEKRGTVPATSSPVAVCFGGCVAEVANVSDQARVGTQQVWAGTWVLSGGYCSTEATASLGLPDGGTGAGPGLCPPGQSYGTFNGAGLCLPSSGDVVTRSVTKEVTVNADGTSVEKVIERSNGGAGSTSTGTITNKDASGNPTGTSTTKAETPKDLSDNELKQFCDLYPDAPICKQSAAGGACGAFTCEGDAAQCAIANAARQLECHFSVVTDASTLGQAVLDGADPLASSLPSPSNATQVNLGTLSVTSIFAATCPSDMTVTLSGQQLTIPFSDVCWILQFLGYVNLIGTLLVCGRILGYWGGA